MAMKIQTTGLEEYAPGGDARLQVMVIGGPGVGKTRFASYWPKPIYLNCEKGLSSIADRRMPYANINNSNDMLDALAFLQRECRRPRSDRQFETVVIDTLDAFQRKVKDEWLQANPGSQSFRGFDAWGYLDSKMQMLLTRLLNLDMNVVVLCHYKEKTIREGTGENATERQEYMLQLSGDVKDTAFNDFDLVGWMGTYWDVVDGQRVQKRGLTFKPTPDKPFLKDRLYVTPLWMEISFTNDDYANLFTAVVSRLDDLDEGQVVGEIPPAEPDSARPAGGVVGPGSGGALPAQAAHEAPVDVPLEAMDKPTLQKMARELGLEFRGNTIKAELVAMIQEAQSKANGVANPDQDSPATAAPGDAVPASPASEASSVAPQVPSAEVQPPQATPARARATGVQSARTDVADAAEQDTGTPIALEDLAASAAGTRPAEPTATVDTEVGQVDPTTGEMTEQQIADALGGQVVSVIETADPAPVATKELAPASTATPAPASPAPVCQVCGKDLAGENQDYVKLAFIKFRQRLCNEDYLKAKAGK